MFSRIKPAYAGDSIKPRASALGDGNQNNDSPRSGRQPSDCRPFHGLGRFCNSSPRVPLCSTLGYILITRFAGSIRQFYFSSPITTLLLSSALTLTLLTHTNAQTKPAGNKPERLEWFRNL